MEKIINNPVTYDINIKGSNISPPSIIYEDTTVNFLKHIPIFSNLDENTLNLIIKLGVQKSFRKNTVVLLEHQTGSALYVIVRGKLKVSRSGEGSKEAILTILNQFDFFGEMSILNETGSSANVTALEDSDLFIIESNDFINLLNNHFEISLALMRELTRRIRAADMKIKSLGLNNAERKVAAVILELAGKTGIINQNRIEIKRIPVQHDLANMAGTSRETISRTLHNFAKRGLIELNGSKVTIINYLKFKDLFG